MGLTRRYELTSDTYHPNVTDLLDLIAQGDRLGFDPVETHLEVRAKFQIDGKVVERLAQPSAIILRGSIPTLGGESD